MITPTFGFIGAGNMALAMIKGLLHTGTSSKQIYLNDTKPDSLSKHKQDLSINITLDYCDLMTQCNVIILAVKPHHVQGACEQLALVSKQNTLIELPLIISVAAGVSTTSMSHWLSVSPNPFSIIRFMPNTPAMLACGATGAYGNKAMTAKQQKLANTILVGMGLSVWVGDEDKIDAITALSGSGPAYFFYIIEALTKQGIALGLKEGDAYSLAVQTAKGGALMASKLATNVAGCEQLRKQVTSPGGTTQAAIEALDKHQVSDGLQHAMQAAYDRAKEL